jgi:hypothetical protein
MRPLPQFLAGVTALALGAAAPPPATLCDFARKVIAEKASDFALLKGAALNPELFKNETFKGTLLPAGAAECTLNIRRQAARNEIPPDYQCTLARVKSFLAANAVFQRASRELGACFPGVKFAAMQDGDGKGPQDGFDWLVAADAQGWSLELEMTNGVALLAQALSGGDGDPDIEVTLDITNTAPVGR